MNPIGNASEFGDLIRCNSNFRGNFFQLEDCCGGENPAATNTITILYNSTTGDAKDFGDLTSARRGAGSSSSSTRCDFWWRQHWINKDIIDYVTIASLGDAIDFGDLTAITMVISATSSPDSWIMGWRSTPVRELI
jgi:hypothetical protein